MCFVLEAVHLYKAQSHRHDNGLVYMIPLLAHHWISSVSVHQMLYDFCSQRQREKKPFRRTPVSNHQGETMRQSEGLESWSLDHFKVVQNGHDVLRHKHKASVYSHGCYRDQERIWHGVKECKILEKRKRLTLLKWVSRLKDKRGVIFHP